MHKRRCRCCRQTFSISRNPQQTYCSKPLCQKSRHRRWKKKRYREDPDYRVNQQAAQQAWRKRHPDYYQDYRARHPDYVAANRQQQQERNHRNRPLSEAKAGKADRIAKRNVLLTDFHFITMPYEVFPGENAWIAKRNALLSKNPYSLMPYERFLGQYG